jgi:hypothetical protein
MQKQCDLASKLLLGFNTRYKERLDIIDKTFNELSGYQSDIYETAQKLIGYYNGNSIMINFKDMLKLLERKRYMIYYNESENGVKSNKPYSNRLK